MQNAKTRPVSWKICKNDKIQEIIDEVGFFAESLFIRIIVSRDNLGRMPANKFLLKGALYPRQNKITPEKIEETLQVLENKGLLLLYKVNGMQYIQLPKIGVWSKLKGNMKETSEYPGPPKEVVDTWEKQFNDVYERCMNAV